MRRTFGERLRHVHLSDNAGKGWDSHLPPGEGVLDLDGFLRELAASEFAGTVSLEVDLRKRLADPARLRGCWSRCASGSSRPRERLAILSACVARPP